VAPTRAAQHSVERHESYSHANGRHACGFERPARSACLGGRITHALPSGHGRWLSMETVPDNERLWHPHRVRRRKCYGCRWYAGARAWWRIMASNFAFERTRGQRPYWRCPAPLNASLGVMSKGPGFPSMHAVSVTVGSVIHRTRTDGTEMAAPVNGIARIQAKRLPQVTALASFAPSGPLIQAAEQVRAPSLGVSKPVPMATRSWRPTSVRADVPQAARRSTWR
jgi:hypothetical protein